MQLRIIGYALSPFTRSDQILRLEALISSLYPDVFPVGLIVDDTENAKPVMSMGSRRNYLLDEIESELARLQDRRAQWLTKPKSAKPMQVQRSHGSVHFVSVDGSENLHVHFDEWTLAPSLSEKRIGNSVSIEKEFGKLDSATDETVRRLCKNFFDGSLFDYGFCCTAEEFQEKNIDRSGGGQRAIGLDASRHLPGLYWGNYFSKRLQERMVRVRERLNGFDSLNLLDGLLLLNLDKPWRWNDPENLANMNTAIETIGKHFFFNIDESGQEELFSFAN